MTSKRGHSFCELCNLRMISEKAMEEHMNGRKHQKLDELKKSRHNEAERSVFIGNLVKGISEIQITDYFLKFGSVAKVIIDKDKHQYAIVEFGTKDDVKQVLASESHMLGDRKVTVKQREWKAFVNRPKHPAKQRSVKGAVMQNEIHGLMTSMSDLNTVSEQMENLLAKFQLSSDDISLRYLICRLLQSVFQEFMPHAAIAPYGSSVNGYGVKDCDLDINLTVDSRDQAYMFSTSDRDDEVVDETPKETSHSTQQLDHPETLDLNEASESDIVELICKIIRQLVPGMKNVRSIPLARKPVVKFCHSQSGLMCDISINNRLALRNTELIAFYAKLHPGLRPLVFAVRLWAKVKQLAGNVGAGPKLTNYALTLLVLTYFEMHTAKLLPSVERLKNATKDVQIIEGWDCSFTLDVDRIDVVRQQESIEILLRGFYQFYARLDFSSHVICPRQGQILSIEEFRQNHGRTTEGRPFKYGSLNLQDPLELNHNVAGNVNEKTAKRLSNELKVAELICESKRFSRCDSSKSWGLVMLVKEGAGEALRVGVVGCLGLPYSNCSFSQGFVTKWKGNMNGAHDDWSCQMVAYIRRILQDVLKFDCHVVLPQADDLSDVAAEKDAENTLKRGGSGDDSPIPVKKIKVDSHSTELGQDCASVVDQPSSLDNVSGEIPRGSNDEIPCGSNEDIPFGSNDEALETDNQSTSSLAISLPGEYLVTFSCKIKSPVWIGRRKTRRVLEKLPEYKTDPMMLESAVTSRVIIEQELMGEVNKFNSGSMCLQMHIRKVSENNSCKILIQMVPITDEAECKNFFHFFENFCGKLLPHHEFQ